MADSRRLVTISVVQFFASVCIMSRHYSFFLAKDFPVLTEAMSGITFTDYFFCCSGFLMHYVYAKKQSVALAPLIRKRFSKLYPLHLATTFFFVAILVVSARLGSLGGTRSGWDCVLPTLTLTHAFGTVDRQCLNYPSWFLSALFALYISYPAVRLLIRKAGAGSLVAVVVMVVIGYEGAYRFGYFQHWSTLTYNFGILRGIPTFLAGVLIAEYLPRIAPRVRSFMPAYAAFGFSLVGMMTGLDPLVCYGILPVALVMLLAAAEANGAPSFLRSRYLVPIGAWSFPLYLLHVPVAALLLNFVVVRVLHLERVPLVAGAVLTAAIAIVASYVTSRLLDLWDKGRVTERRASPT